MPDVLPKPAPWFEALRTVAQGQAAPAADGRSASFGARVADFGDRYREIYKDRADVQVDRVRTFIITTSRMASDDGVLIPDGMDASEFDRRPVALWAHDEWRLPIGRWLNRRRITTPENGWEADVEFAPPEVSEEADDVFRFLAWAGFGAASMRFRVLDGGNPTPEEMVLYSMPRYGWIGRKWVLKEISICNIPADAGCLMVSARSEASAGRLKKLLAARAPGTETATVVTAPAEPAKEPGIAEVVAAAVKAQFAPLVGMLGEQHEELLAGFAALAAEFSAMREAMAEKTEQTPAGAHEEAQADGGESDAALYLKLLDSPAMAALAKKVGA